MFGAFGHPLGCCCTGCAAGASCAGTRGLGYIGYGAPGVTFGAMDPEVAKELIEGGTLVATTAIGVAERAAQRKHEQKLARSSGGSAKRKRKKRKAKVALPAVPPPPPKPGPSPALIAVGVVGALALVGFAFMAGSGGGSRGGSRRRVVYRRAAGGGA